MTWLLQNFREIVSSRPFGFSCSFWWIVSACLLYTCGFQLLQLRNCFLKTCFTKPSSRSCRVFFPTTTNLWRSKLQKFSTFEYCSQIDNITGRKRRPISPKNLCKYTEPPSTLPTKNSFPWIISLR